MSNLTDIAETRTANWLAGQATTPPVLPFRLAVVTANGTDNAAGTEVSGNGYQRQQFSFGAANGDTVSNEATIRFDLMPAATIVGIEIYDSAATPVRWFYGSLAVQRQTVANDPLEFAPGALQLKTA